MASIAWIGLGNMGSPMARNLLPSTDALTVYNRTASKAEIFVKNNPGAKMVERVEDIDSDIVFTSLATDEAVLQIFGKLECLSGKTVVDTSTILPDTVEQLSQIAKEKGGKFVHCPVMGAVAAADQAQLIALLAGVDKCCRQKIKKLLVPSVARLCIDLGDEVTKSSMLKLCGNFMILGIVELLGEGFTLAEKCGVDKNDLYQVYTEMFPAPSFKNYGAVIKDGSHGTVLGINVKNGLKDAKHIRELAERSGAGIPTIDLAIRNLNCANDKGKGEEDWSALVHGIKVLSNLE
ncbi:putative oxidoreductase [Neolecta irregularis DAH-3]|uniref:Putative oxidoreductase n=1 Tax=Neolecta irregularis (strain DAH-3) TaxID=1198029 RepID=A0A1U7LMG8_NEOID|nr:putative oxidoreductase [Neolecta irregularis DAH-3]|eukprot:OLL23855.1 putative oxidoreductase [Neolecta irregularis DAH-3]